MWVCVCIFIVPEKFIYYFGGGYLHPTVQIYVLSLKVKKKGGRLSPLLHYVHLETYKGVAASGLINEWDGGILNNRQAKSSSNVWAAPLSMLYIHLILYTKTSANKNTDRKSAKC